MRHLIYLLPLCLALAACSGGPRLDAEIAPSQRASDALAEGDSLYGASEWVAAEEAYRDALGLATVDGDSALVAQSAGALGWILVDAGRFEEGEAILARAAGSRGAATDSLAASAWLDLAFVRYRLGELTPARLAAEEALRRATVGLGEEHPLAAQALNQIGLVHLVRAEFAEAEQLFRRVLELSERMYGPVHDDVAAVLGNLAPVLQQRGDLEGARDLFRRALRIDSTLHGFRSLPVATDLDRLAFLHLTAGDLGAALALYERALAIELEVGPADHPRLAGTLHNLGDALARVGRHDEAAEQFREAHAIAAATLGSGHPEASRPLIRLAALAVRDGRGALADSLSTQALADLEGTLGTAHPLTITARETVARVAAFEGRTAVADSLLSDALRAVVETLGPEHPNVAGLALQQAWVALRESDLSRAEAHLSRAGAVLSEHARVAFPRLSAAEQVAFAETAAGPVIGLTLLSHAGRELPPGAYQRVAAWKGIVHEGLRQQAALERAAQDGTPEARESANRLASIRRELAEWRGATDRVAMPTWRARNDSLIAARETTERALAVDGGDVVDPMAEVESPSDVLISGEALVDLYRISDTVAWDGRDDPPARYVAVVSVPGAGASVVEAGPARLVDAAVEAWRAAAVSGAAAGVERTALLDAVWAPIEAALPPEVSRVWVSPDASLARVPWASLVGSAERLVAEIVSPRALAQLRSGAAPDIRVPSAVLVGDVTFGPDGPWEPLVGTRQEVEELADIARGADISATLLTGSDPTPEAVSRLAEVSAYVHVATHGYVDARPLGGGGRAGPDIERVPGAPSALDGTTAYSISRTPLLASGIALAGANEGPGGLLTADDLARLDLGGTRLVTLSACDTGRGAVISGQGVLGLRASLAVAGARTLLLSLWPVDDEVTAVLMAAFYDALWREGREPADALRTAQEAVRAAGWEAPTYWAPWVLDGEAW